MEKKENSRRGFVTIATGDKKYHKLAHTLLVSYREKAVHPLSFCVITDEMSEYTKAFDDVVIIDNAKKSYVDKIDLMVNAPYEETIFIDADSIAYGDLNQYWEWFDGKDAVSAFGETLPLNEGGWYPDTNRIGEFKEKVQYGINLHGGIYYFRKGNVLENVYRDCQKIMKEYDKYLFHNFTKPADEPVIALAMAANGCKPIKCDLSAFLWLRKGKHVKADYFNGNLKFCIDDRTVKNALLLHFGTAHTIMPLYQIESSKVQFYKENHRSWNGIERVSTYLVCYSKAFVLGIQYARKIMKKKKNI